MRAELTQSGVTLYREPGDKRLGKESTVAFHIKRLLNATGGKFVRINPSRYGLTSCKVGVADHKQGVILWHERYAIELAHAEFNAGKVFLQRTAEER